MRSARTTIFALALAAVLAAAPELRAAEPACSAPRAGEPVLLLVHAGDPALAAHDVAVDAALRTAAAGALELLPYAATTRALHVEGGAEEREQAVVNARVVIGRAEDRFRELDDEEALALIARATARLGAAHQEPGAIELLSRAHLLAGAIFLSRGRAEAARQRLQRALDLSPDLAPPRDRYAPEVIAELAAVRAGAALRPTGRLTVRARDLHAEVFLDGRRVGETPLVLEGVAAGNHLVRLGALGKTSHVETLQIAASDDRLLDVELAPDPELSAINRFLAAPRGEDAREVLAMLGRRGGARRVLLATTAIAPALSPTATATLGVELAMLDGGRAYAASLDVRRLARAIAGVLACEPGDPGVHLAPSLFGRAAPSVSRPAPVPEALSVWERPWFWAVAAVAAIGLSGALVVARTAGGPPEAVEIRLVPRP